jgi:DNA repair protein RadC
MIKMKNAYEVNGNFSVAEKENRKPKAAKRVNIVSVRLVKEASMLYKRRSIGSPADSYEILKEFLEDLDREAFIVVSLDTKNQPLSINIAHIGNINSSIVSPACVMRVALLSNAASILVGHNHPSGNPEPSEQDLVITKKLEEVGELMGIRLLDHLIIGDGNYISLKEWGIL